MYEAKVEINIIPNYNVYKNYIYYFINIYLGSKGPKNNLYLK